MQKVAAGRFRQRDMREQQLPRGKPAGVARIDWRPGAEKRHLKPQVLAVGSAQPAGDIPPFGAKLLMRAVIGGEVQGHTRTHDRVRRDRNQRHCGKQGPGALHHQSSRTDWIALFAVARRPATNAVAAAAPTNASATPSSVPNGMRVVIVQWNDCGLIT